jgi:hypothetical protein
MKIMGQRLVTFSIENPCISLTLFFLHHFGITKIHMKIMGQHLVIISRSAALRDTLTLEEDPGVSEYLSECILLCQSAYKMLPVYCLVSSKHHRFRGV